MGHAAADVKGTPRLRSRRAQESPRSQNDHGEARLRARQEIEGYRIDAQYPAISRPGSTADRPIKGDLYRRRAGADRHSAMVSEGHAWRLYNRAQSHWQWPRRPGPDLIREFYLWRRRQLRSVLQSGSRQDGRPAVDGIRPIKT